jgi:penicillin G amidase
MIWIRRGGMAIILLALVIVLGGYFYLTTSLPQTDGEQKLAGLSAPVTVIRDASGIPHIEAENLTDAAYSLGFVHAQDRLWQMETNRRIGAGRLSEILGKTAIDKDRFLRTLGVYAAAKRTFDELDDKTKNLMQAYAKGVNGFLETRTGALPIEFLILGFEPEPWSVYDSVVWTKMMSWDLSKNWGKELERMRLLRRLTPEQVADLLPPNPGDLVSPLPDFRETYKTAMGEADTLFAMMPEPLPEGAGSNNWVVSGKNTVSGKPILANDPHLGLAAPALWYFAHLKTPEISSIGATLPGVPAIILGRNENIAWGFTNTGPDVQDLFIEKINPENPLEYKTPEGWAQFELREEVIKIKDDAAITIRVRTTRHGPVLSDAVKSMRDALADDHVIAFAWTALKEGDLTPTSASDMMQAKNWDDFKEAIRTFTSPQQNMVYADIDGNIGYYAPGKVPIRDAENEAMGRMPVPGWLDKYDWKGEIPFEKLPQAYNPERGYHYTANEKIVPNDYPYFLSVDWSKPYRANRVAERLEQEEKHSIQTFMDMQSDVKSLMAEEFLEILLATKPADEIARKALTELSIWEGTMTKEGAAPLIFNAWVRQLNKYVYADEMGDLFKGYWKQRPLFLKKVLLGQNGRQKWCDDVTTDQKESCADILSKSLSVALADLSERYGDDISDWNWGEAHFAHSDHLPFSHVKPLNMLFDIKVPSMGDTFTMNVGRNRLKDEKQPFANVHAASLRAIYDMSDLNNSIFIHSTGQSGNIMSPFYDDMAEDWANMKYRKMTTDKAEYSKDALGTLTLLPLN